jgi:hypothetical protein
MPVMQACKVPVPDSLNSKLADQVVPETLTEWAGMPFQVTDTLEPALTNPEAGKLRDTVSSLAGGVEMVTKTDMAFSLNETYLSICSITTDRNNALDG